MKEETIRQSILPVAQQSNSCIIGTTTPQGSDNIASRMITEKDDVGDTIFAVVRIGKPCEECAAKRVICNHDNSSLEGLSRKKRNRYANLYKGNEEVMRREFCGEITDTSTRVFTTDSVKALMQKPPTPLKPPIDMLMMCMDPAQGGPNDVAMLTMYYDRYDRTMVIVQMDTIRMPNSGEEHIISNFLRAVGSIRAIPHLQYCPIVVACESAPNMFPQMISETINRMNAEESLGVYVMHEMPNDRAGTPKTHMNTQTMTLLSKELLESNRVAFSEHCTCSVVGTSVEKMKQQLANQLSNFKKRFKRSTDNFGNLIARLDGKEGGMNDDLAVTFIMAFYWYNFFWASTSARYEPVKLYSSSWRTAIIQEKNLSIKERIDNQMSLFQKQNEERMESILDRANEVCGASTDENYDKFLNIYQQVRQEKDREHTRNFMMQMSASRSML